MSTTADPGRRLHGVAVVLVAPKDPINVGAAVRACRLSAIDDLRVVGDVDRERALISAPGCEAFIENRLRTFPDFTAATEDRDARVAFTARQRQDRVTRLGLPQLGPWLRDRATLAPALVFGPEDRGLDNDIVDRCDAVVTLASANDFSSFNLAQAVMVVGHRLFEEEGLDRDARAAKKSWAPPRSGDVDRMIAQAERALDAIGFFKGSQRRNVVRTLRRVVSHTAVDARELATLWAIFADVERWVHAATDRFEPHQPS
ncbi:MAG: hypothetical protein H6700_02475 [Myxococcales bacterium]|nr:hypothetical protein [Myxococcales bacterium]